LSQTVFAFLSGHQIGARDFAVVEGKKRQPQPIGRPLHRVLCNGRRRRNAHLAHRRRKFLIPRDQIVEETAIHEAPLFEVK
jgi:hypothetical protein